MRNPLPDFNIGAFGGGVLGSNRVPAHGYVESKRSLMDVHPFKVITTNDQVRVYPGYLYSIYETRLYQRIKVLMNGSELGDPVLAETMPTLTLQTGILWIKINLSNGIVNTATIAYETEADTFDTDSWKYIKIAKTYTDGRVEQYLRSDAFVTILPKNWCQVTQDSITAATTGTVNIADGCVMVTETGTVTASDPAPTKTLVRLKVAGDFKPKATTAVAVSNGDKVYVKLTYTKTSYGTPSVHLYQCTDATYLVTSGTPTDNSTTSHVLIADISIASSIMNVTMHDPGVITAPCLTLPKEAGTPYDASEMYWYTEALSSTSVNIRRGLLIGYTWYVDSASEDSRAVQVFQTTWEQTDTTIVGEDIEITGLTDGDYLWVEAQLAHTRLDHVSSDDTGAGTNTVEVTSQEALLETAGADIPFIGHGASFTGAADGTFRWPFAQINSGVITQLHLGIIQCPHMLRTLDFT